MSCRIERLAIASDVMLRVSGRIRADDIKTFHRSRHSEDQSSS
jgi:hypothetical protein